MYTAKNHTEGPDKLVIGGELVVEGDLKFGEGALKPALYMSDSTASTVADLRTAFNKLLANLRAAGVMMPNPPVIEFTKQPESAEATEGEIDVTLSVEAVASDGRDVTYQWYSNSTDANEGGTVIDNETDAEYSISDALEAGTYYYYCVASATDAVSVASDVATVTIVEAEEPEGS